MKKSTEELLHILKHAKEPLEYIEGQREELIMMPLSEYLEQYIMQNGQDKAEVIRKSGLDRTYAYQIFAGRKQPSRDKLLALCIAMEMELDKVQATLKANSYPILYPKVERDSIIIFAIQKHVSVIETNELLYELGQEVID